MRILIVDDDSKQMPQIVDCLALDGHTVTHLSDADDVLRLTPTHRFDGIVIDLMWAPFGRIPRDATDDGYTAGLYVYEKWIRPKFPNVPTLVLTGVDQGTRHFRKAIDGFSEYDSYIGYLEKPANEDEIVERFGAALRRREGASE